MLLQIYKCISRFYFRPALLPHGLTYARFNRIIIIWITLDMTQKPKNRKGHKLYFANWIAARAALVEPHPATELTLLHGDK